MTILGMDLERLADQSDHDNDQEGSRDEERRDEINLAGGNRVDDKKKKEKQRRPVKVIKLDDLINRETGLRAFYETVKKNELKLTKKAQINPDKALEDYLALVKGWAFSVAPKYEFNYFMDRCQTFGHKKEFTEELNHLRKYHKGEVIYNPETRGYEPNDGAQRRVLITTEGPVVERDFQDEIRRESRAEYDPTTDPERNLESFVPKESLEYSIKKKEVKRNESGKGSPSVGHSNQMDVETPTF